MSRIKPTTNNLSAVSKKGYKPVINVNRITLTIFKVRFANFSTDVPNVDLTLAGSGLIFSNVAYGNFGDQTIIAYDANGKAPATIPGLSWKTLGPFKEIDAVGAKNLELRNSITQTVIPIVGSGLSNLTFEAGKIYTVFINGSVSGVGVGATIITHSK